MSGSMKNTRWRASGYHGHHVAATDFLQGIVTIEMKEAEFDDMKYLRQDSKESAKLREAISKIREMEAVPGRKKKVRDLRAYIRLNYRGEYADFLGNELRRFL